MGHYEKQENNILEIEKNNLTALNEKLKHPWDGFLGNSGQQNMLRVTQYKGFEFVDPEKLDTKIWVKDKEYPQAFVPNRRTKQGKEMQKFIDSLEQSSVFKIKEILSLPMGGTFIFPYLEICKDILVLYLDDNLEVDFEDLIEITKKEFRNIIFTMNEGEG